MELRAILLFSLIALCRGGQSIAQVLVNQELLAGDVPNAPSSPTPAPVFPSGQLRAVLALAEEAAVGLNGLTSEVIKEGVGTFIRTHYKDGCLDAGCCMGIRKEVRFSENCPSWGWLKWFSNGPMLVVYRPFFHSCLECENGDKDCLIVSSACRGKHSQFWHLSDTGEKNPRGENLFTIVSDLHPQRCVTIDEASSNLQLKPCEYPTKTQLFYVTKNQI